jgi:hypothetical protein
LLRVGELGGSELGGREELREVFPQLALELLNAGLELLYAPIHPQQLLDHDPPTYVIDRLRLGALQGIRSGAPRLCPPTN